LSERAKVKNGNKSIENDPRSGYPGEAVISRKVARVEELVNENLTSLKK